MLAPRLLQRLLGRIKIVHRAKRLSQTNLGVHIARSNPQRFAIIRNRLSVSPAGRSSARLFNRSHSRSRPRRLRQTHTKIRSKTQTQHRANYQHSTKFPYFSKSRKHPRIITFAIDGNRRDTLRNNPPYLQHCCFPLTHTKQRTISSVGATGVLPPERDRK